ncbi:SUKH-4 family immunity protein [Streptomyces sp. NPDC048279]|uniref:SUKH-4 family immunity protein n=1 Tax=Streptomyces sp. NPDC048279 TaxID=3154714 RepID=UPI0034417303
MSTTSTTGSGAAAITLTEAELDRYITHEPTRMWLSGPGLPDTGGLLTFEPLRTAGLRTLADVADLTAGPSRLAEDLRDRLVIGELLAPAGLDTESILLDGGTGEISTAYLVDPADPRPLAPSLETLLRFAAVTEELTGLRGRFAALAGTYGTKTATEASRRLLELFEEGTAAGRVPPYWKATALIRPLSLVAGPGPGTDSGLAVDLPARLLDQEFGQGRVARFEEVDFPPTLTHEPTRRFLRETGLPEDAVLFHLDPDAPLPTLREYFTDVHTGDFPLEALPPHAGRLIRLGHLVEENSLVVDGTTGAILNFSEPEATLHPLNTDISTLAFTLWLLHHERTIDEHLNHELTTEAYDQLAATMLHTLATIDPTPTTTDAQWHYWTELFQDEAGGVL